MKSTINICPLIVYGLFFILLNSCDKKETIEEPNTVTDIDGNVYHTVTIGTQVWMAENLKVTHYRNGDLIGTTFTEILDISKEVEPKYQWAYNGEESNVDLYGRLYTWHAITDNRFVCPKGWHIPTYDEWAILVDYLIANGYNYDGTTTGNKCAKSFASSMGWNSSTNEGAIGNTDYPNKRNSSGFSALPGGVRNDDGKYTDLGGWGYWWSSTEYLESKRRYYMHLSFGLPNTLFGSVPSNINAGMPVRCLHD